MMQPVLLLPGQGSQFAQMGLFLYGVDAVFSAAVDSFLTEVGEWSSVLLHQWQDPSGGPELQRGAVAQPLLFMINCAAAASVISRIPGSPVTLLGHSVGELAAAFTAGVFDVNTSAQLLRRRADLLDRAPCGGLAAVAASAADIDVVLAGHPAVVVGAMNSDQQSVISGPEPELTGALKELRNLRFTCMRVDATEPFHSPAVNRQAVALGRFLCSFPLHQPQLPIVSSWTARFVSSDDAVDATFWTHQMAQLVSFWPALLNNLDRDGALFIEVGPGRSLTACARRLPSVRSGASDVVSLMPEGRRAGADAWHAGMEKVQALCG